MQTYRYRWVVLAVFAFISAAIQIQWLTFAPIAREARTFYNAGALQIDFLSLLFMVVFIIVCIPASFIIDAYGIRIGIGIGAALTGVFGLMKGFFGDSYTMVVIAQIMLAVGQPFIINAATKVAGVWFPVRERATVVGIATLAQFIGIIIAVYRHHHRHGGDAGSCRRCLKRQRHSAHADGLRRRQRRLRRFAAAVFARKTADACGSGS